MVGLGGEHASQSFASVLHTLNATRVSFRRRLNTFKFIFMSRKRREIAVDAAFQQILLADYS